MTGWFFSADFYSPLGGFGRNPWIVRIDLLGRWAELVSLVGSDPVLNQLPARYVR
jgi:hypothetical protein